MSPGIGTCPRCGRTVRTYQGRYNTHGIEPGSPDICMMSKRRQPISGMNETAFESRAYLVTELASELQDEDPHVTWEYLTALPAVEVQRLLMVALAGIETEGRTLTEIFGWVNELPIARIQGVVA